MVNDSAWRTTMPMIGPPAGHPGMHERPHAGLREKNLIARARRSACSAFFGSRRSWVPHPISAGAVPSS